MCQQVRGVSRNGAVIGAVIGAVVSLLLLGGCGGGDEVATAKVNKSEPSLTGLSAELARELPKHVKVTNFNLESMEKSGTEEKPKFKMQFKATVEVTEQLFRFVELRGRTVFIEPGGSVGDTAEVEGSASSNWSVDDWSHFVRVRENYTLKNYGKPKSDFAGAILKGSAEEAKFFADLEATDDEFQASIAELDITAMVGDFYQKDRKGKTFLFEMLDYRVEKEANTNATVHAKFSFAHADSRDRSSGTTRRAFKLRRKEGGPWRVGYMGPRDSGKIE